MEGGKQYEQLVGSRRQVFNGTAKKTGYGKAALTKKHLKMNKHGRIVSAKKSKASRKNKNLGKFLQKRGSKTFGPVLAKGGMKGGNDEYISTEEWKLDEFKAALKDAQAKEKLHKDALQLYSAAKEKHGEEHEETLKAKDAKTETNNVSMAATKKVQQYHVYKKKNADGIDCQPPLGHEKNSILIHLKEVDAPDKCESWKPVTPGHYELPMMSLTLTTTHYLAKKAPAEEPTEGGKKKAKNSKK